MGVPKYDFLKGEVEAGRAEEVDLLAKAFRYNGRGLYVMQNPDPDDPTQPQITDKFGMWRDKVVDGEVRFNFTVKTYPFERAWGEIRSGLRGFLRVLGDPLGMFLGGAAGIDVPELLASIQGVLDLSEDEKVDWAFRKLGQNKAARLYQAFRRANADGVVTEEEAEKLGELASDLLG